MTNETIIQTALDNLQRYAHIRGKWVDYGAGKTGGRATLFVNNKKLMLQTEIKKEVRNLQIPEIERKAEEYPGFLLVAERIYPKLKEELRRKNIAYLEINGNIYLNKQNIYIWIEVNKPVIAPKKIGNKAFTRTGLKVIFQFFLDNTLINQPYRTIAEKTGIALGNVNNIMNALKEEGFLLKLDRKKYKMINKKELLAKWMTAFADKLQPALQVGTFRFLKKEDFTGWERLPLHKGKTWWGGEPAGDILTRYLHPGELTLYTDETRNELIRHYRLIPDEKGNVRAFKKFWQLEDEGSNIVPPLLAYVDLMNTNDRRCRETAEKLYEQYLQNEF